jgi:hypothetical protein
MFMNDKLERMWKEAAVAFLRSVETEKNHETAIQNSLCRTSDSKVVSPEYEAEVRQKPWLVQILEKDTFGTEPRGVAAEPQWPVRYLWEKWNLLISNVCDPSYTRIWDGINA